MRSEVDVLVIGGGHNGLIAACYLAREKLDTLVVEALPTIGGMSRTEFPFAGAPRHAINPCALDVIFLQPSKVIEDLRLADVGFRMLEVDPFWAHLDAEEASIALWRDRRRTAEEITRFSARDATAYLDLCETLDAILWAGLPFFACNPTRPSLRALTQGGRAALRARGQLGKAVDLVSTAPLHTIQERFEHPIVRDLMAEIVTIGGASVRSEAASLAFVMLAFPLNFGCGRPVGGTQTLVDSLVRRLQSLGGAVRADAGVDQILVRGNSAYGVRLANGGEIGARRAVVSSCDPRTTLQRLLPAGALADDMAGRVAGIPANVNGRGDLKIDVALSGQLRMTRHERWRGDAVDLRAPLCLMGTLEELDRSFASVATGDTFEPIPFGGVVPTAIDPSQAPEGQDTLYLWSGWVPAEPAEPADEYKARAEKSLMALAATYYDGLESLEIGRRTMTTEDIARHYSSSGSLVHVDFTPFRMGPLRPAWGFGGYRTPVKGLYLSGSGTHPGGGLSGFPGRNAAATVLRDCRSRRRSRSGAGS
ncbi:MAG: phytoene desaturase family protein [Acidimicrobiia bacterium]